MTSAAADVISVPSVTMAIDLLLIYIELYNELRAPGATKLFEGRYGF